MRSRRFRSTKLDRHLVPQADAGSIDLAPIILSAGHSLTTRRAFTHNQLTLAKALNRQRSVKSIAIMLSASLFALSGCALGKKMLEQPSGPPQEQSAKLERKTEVFTGKVVLVDGAYRLSLLKDPDTLLRLTRARRETEFAQQQINLRKYYEKTISVNGTLQDDWIFGADIVGQWTPPGGATGPNMNAPKQTRP